MFLSDFDKKFEPFWKQLTFKIFWSNKDETWVATCTHPKRDLTGLSGLSLVRKQFRSEDDALNMLRVAVERAFEIFEEEEDPP